MRKSLVLAALLVPTALRALAPLSGTASSQIDPAYLKAYAFDGPAVSRRLGTVPAGDFQVAVQVARPKRPVGSAVLVHGYLDHSAAFASLSTTLLKNRWTVILVDLPGHGLSSGPRGDINRFRQYAQALEAVDQAVPSRGRRAWVAHSAGAAAVLESLAGPSPVQGELVILLAPLVRNRQWGWARFGRWLLSPFINRVARIYRSSANKKGGRDLKSDPLQVTQVPLNWSKALFQWEKSLKKRKFQNRSVLVLQGDKDEVVDWRHNRHFLEAKLPKLKWEMMSGATHLMFDSPPENQAVVERILKALAR